MAVRGDVVAWLGSDDVGRNQFPDAEMQDLDGGFVAPGFVDSHIHLSATGLTLSGLDLRSAASRPQCIQLVADYAAAHPDQPVWGHGWDESAWPENTPPSTSDLDAVLGDRPAYLARVDVHSALASTGLRRLIPDLPRAAGFADQLPLAGDAHHLVRAVARDLLTTEQLTEARVTALDALAAAGIVAVHECAGPQIGALGSHTAWLHQPYADAPECTGTCHVDPAAVQAHVRACTEVQVTAGFHVIGDAAVSAAVDAFERVVADLGVAAVARCGHRLEHVEMVTAAQAEKLGAWGVIASVQPNFDALWGGRAGMYARRLGMARASELNPLALLASQGVPLALGSDAPVTGIDPWVSVRAAVNHHTPGSALSARAAFAAATRGGWRAAGVGDGNAGTLVPGAPASYAVWDAGTLDAHAPGDAVQRWSTDPRSRVPALPRLGPTDAVPRCRQTVHRGAVIYG